MKKISLVKLKEVPKDSSKKNIKPDDMYHPYQNKVREKHSRLMVDRGLNQ